MSTSNKHYIYLVRNIINGKLYVGATKSKNRWKSHINESGKDNKKSIVKPLYAAMREFGVDSFEFVILVPGLGEDKAFELEKKFIESLSTLIPNGYNVSLGGKGALGVKRDENTRTLMSKAAKITSSREDVRAARSKLLKERWKTDTNYIELALKALRGPRKKWADDDDRRIAHGERMKGNTHLLGHRHTEETRKKISEVLKGRRPDLSEEERARRSERMRKLNQTKPAMKGRVFSDHHRMMLSLAAKNRKRGHESN